MRMMTPNDTDSMPARGATTSETGAMPMSVLWRTLSTELVDGILEQAVPRDLDLILSEIYGAPVFEPRFGHYVRELGFATQSPAEWNVLFTLLRISKKSHTRTANSIGAHTCVYIDNPHHVENPVSVFKSLNTLGKFGRLQVDRVASEYHSPADTDWSERGCTTLRAMVSATVPGCGDITTPLDVAWQMRSQPGSLKEASALRELMELTEENIKSYEDDEWDGHNGSTIPPGIKDARLICMVWNMTRQYIGGGYAWPYSDPKSDSVDIWVETNCALMKELERGFEEIEDSE
ncbi:uncharacterized protein RCC_07076 [Ramularia collo-cygni]|uniref:Uncharacterized protein n=1 Tax=Ramularia collo-cygni TaxID=112498 RepID=A0A2D3VEF6_9PEZI|nr:uncharacterized protein RCC_07076 [Ramularia collo-cygni]CZT21214.1 uncharacterized protein RCC_07076 [Ramularia collo-cygni]